MTILTVLGLMGCARNPAIEARRIVASPVPTPTPRPIPPARPKPSAAIGGVASPAGGLIWDCIAEHESGSRWTDNSYEGGVWYEGGLHFLHSTWVDAGGRRYAEHAYQATREQQITIAAAWLKVTSWASQWPNTSRICGVR